MADARVVSNRFVELAKAEGNTLTPMQVLKLVYIAHGYSLGVRGTPLIHNQIEAWKYGPVIPDLYHDIKHWRDQPVQAVVATGLADIDNDDAELIGAVYENYRKFSGIKLSSLTHQKNTPWDKVYRANEIHTPIPNDLIEDHYRELLTD
ncbi:MAG: Panacea domain-containing protein [Planktomarina sp.]